MDDAEKLDRQAFKVQLSQGRMILKLTARIDQILTDTGAGMEPAASATILDLAKAAAFLGGRGA